MDFVASVIIPVYNNLDLTKATLDSLRRHTDLPYEVTIIDNASTEDVASLKLLSEVTTYIRNDTNVGFVKAVNQGLKLGTGEHYIIANNDIRVANCWLEKLVETANSSDDIGIVGLMSNDGGWNQALVFCKNFSNNDLKSPENVNAWCEKEWRGQAVEEKNSVIFSLALIKRSLIAKIGVLDENYGMGFGDDGDYNIRAREAGFRTMIRRDGYYFHHFRSTFRKLYSDAEIEDMQAKNIDKLESRYPLHWKYQDSQLKILVTNNHLMNLGGSETYTYALVKELNSRGHYVHVFTFFEGLVSRRISKYGLLVKSSVYDYDLALVSHNTCLSTAKLTRGFKIFTAHGITPVMEQPHRGADAYVAVSAEVQNYLSSKGYESEVIINGIDCERFKPTQHINDKPKVLLSLCQQPSAREFIRKVCEKAGITWLDIPTFDRVWNIEDYINQADVVVSLGRGAYEAMACGRNVIVYDERHYQGKFGDGLVTSENAGQLQECNFSGRAFKKAFTEDEFIAELEKYDPAQGAWNREYALEHLNIKKQVDKYLDLYYARNSRNN